jgi:hypothetical protein
MNNNIVIFKSTNLYYWTKEIPGESQRMETIKYFLFISFLAYYFQTS